MVLSYKLTTTNALYNGTPSNNGTTAVFGDAYMNAVQTAFSNSGSDTNQVKAALSVGLGSKTGDTDNDARIYLSYTHFTGNLTHDPTLGLSVSTIDNNGETSTNTSIDDTSSDDSKLDGFQIGIVTFILVTIPVLIKRKYRWETK